MFSILDLQHRPEPALAAAPSIEEPAKSPEIEGGEFEFVLGRRQVASLMFVFTVILMICVAGSYLAGKATYLPAPQPADSVAAAVTQVVTHEPDPPPIVLNQEPAPAPLPEAPLFGQPNSGAVYIQMGAVEKGVAVIFAEGLRKRELKAFVAPGPNEKIFRVLIGPLADPAAYVKAKKIVDEIGLATFARRFPN